MSEKKVKAKKRAYYIYEEGGVYHVAYDHKTAFVTPEDFPEMLERMIDLGSSIYLWDASLLLDDLLTFFKDRNYACVAPSTPIKECSTRTIRPLVSDLGDVIKIDIIGKKRKASKIYAADRMVKTHNPELIKEIQRYGSQKRPQTTMPSICRYAWERWGKNTPYIIKELVPDACKINLNDDVTLEDYCRKAYRGGFLYMNAMPGKIYENVHVYDYNAMYTSIMSSMPMPVGNPVYEKGEPSKMTKYMTKKGKAYYYIHIRTKLRLKKDGIACIRLGYDDIQKYYHERDYLTTSKKWHPDKGYRSDEAIELYLTCTDWTMMKENYHLTDLEIIDHIWFVTKNDLFESYNRYFYRMKNEHTGVKKQVGKNFNNFLAGSMARGVQYTNAIYDFNDPVIDEETGEILCDYSVHLEDSTCGKSTIYIGAAITAYGRKKIIDLIKKNRARWLYSDTDSVHLIGEGLEGEKIDGEELGAMKVEHIFKKVCYYTKKRYIGYDTLTGKYDGAFSGLNSHDRNLLLNTLNYLASHGNHYNHEKNGEFVVYNEDMYEDAKKILEHNCPFSQHAYEFDSRYVFEIDNFLKGLGNARIMTTYRKSKNFHIKRIYAKLIKIDDLGYKFL